MYQLTINIPTTNIQGGAHSLKASGRIPWHTNGSEFIRIIWKFICKFLNYVRNFLNSITCKASDCPYPSWLCQLGYTQNKLLQAAYLKAFNWHLLSKCQCPAATAAGLMPKAFRLLARKCFAFSADGLT